MAPLGRRPGTAPTGDTCSSRGVTWSTKPLHRGQTRAPAPLAVRYGPDDAARESFCSGHRRAWAWLPWGRYALGTPLCPDDRLWHLLGDDRVP